MKKMEGKVVLITGGARGIGYGIAKAFAEEGANIVITGRTASTLIEARENLEADYGIEALFVVADGGDETAVKNVVKQAIDRFGRRRREASSTSHPEPVCSENWASLPTRLPKRGFGECPV